MTTIFEQNFNALPLRDPILAADWHTAFSSGFTFNTGSDTTFKRTAAVSAPNKGGVIQQTYPINQVGGGSGLVVQMPFNKPLEKATITYEIKFLGTGFDFGGGGKLPGLGGVLAGHGSPPSGGYPSIYGWSCRFMWITPKSYSSAAKPAELIGYMYDPTQTGASGDTFGQNRRTNFSLQPDTWYTISQSYQMNSVKTEGKVGNPDGVHTISVNGQQVFSNTKQVYRIFQAASITHLVWSTFYGGGQTWWAPQNAEQRIQFNWLRITD